MLSRALRGSISADPAGDLRAAARLP